ncbi:MAG: histidine kinase dimerization/phospho-acceptor domain-containing protein, partial [Thermoplasmatota archaeon]
MRLAVAVALAALLLPLPAAAPSSPLFLGAELHIQERVDAKANLKEVYPPSTMAVPSSQACGTGSKADNFEVDTGDGEWFRFRDDSSQKGCGEARFNFTVPAGATQAEVRYTASRQVTQDGQVKNFQLPVNFTQEVHTYAPDGGLRSRHFPIDPTATNWNKTVYTFTEDLEGMRQFNVGWLFEDHSQGFNLPQNDQVLSQTIVATVEEATVTFKGIPLDTARVEESHGAEGNGVQRQSLTVTLPVTPRPGYRVGVAVRTAGPLVLDFVTDPLGVTLPARSVIVQPDPGATSSTTILDPLAVARNGYGEYKFTFTAAAPLSADAAMTVFVVLMLILPGVMAGLSIRQWLQLRRQAGTSYPHVAQQYLWAILGAQAVYIMVLGWVLVTQPFPLLVAWPMESQAVLLLGILLACTGAFFGLAFLAKGRLVRLAETDLASKRRANLELERSNRDLEQFAYVASHDLQEPLRAVAGYTQLLQHRYGNRLDPQAQQYIRNAVEGADRMLGLIHGLLAYSRIGTDHAKAAPTDLAVALGEALGNLEIPLKESGGRVTVLRRYALVKAHVHGDRITGISFVDRDSGTMVEIEAALV